jgi:ribonuclease T1
MRRALPLLALALALLAASTAWGFDPRGFFQPRTIAHAALPVEAQRTLELIRRGGPFPYRKDGSTFQNRERRLPDRPRGYYREYTVPTPGSPDRGARRIVAGAGEAGDVRTSGEYWYTADHYGSFRRIVE